MATYSYSKAQLNKRDQPAKPFWSLRKIAIAAAAFTVTCVAISANQPAPVAVAPSAPVVVAQPAPVASTEPVRDMPEACIKAKATREECDQAIALYNAQQNQGPTWSGQEFNQNRKTWAE
jgi:hypothetical protein